MPVLGSAAAPVSVALPDLGHRPARRVLFFESLMNTDMPHNDAELSQGVLHMASALAPLGSEVVLANVKMSITDHDDPMVGLDTLQTALEGEPIELVCITLLEGYFDGVERLIAELRRLGCRAHIAVGGVMPTLAPEPVAAHLADISFVCRGAGEYFVPRLAAIIGAGANIDTPLSAAQCAALLEMQGLIAIDRAASVLISAASSVTVEIEDLDQIELDLRHIQPRHLVHGVEISTSRGCIHKCTFCSILGRQSYQSRSADGMMALLSRYEDHYKTLFGEEIPRNAFRLHISDDDFACERERAATFLRALPSTPFRLSSIQVSVADLCLKDGNKLLPEPDPALVDAIAPQIFADHDARVPARDFIEDHRSRRWSAYLAIGVETFDDEELRRLGKGYKREHVRAMVQTLAERGIHVDAYFIASNAETRAENLVSSVEEVCRLKLRHARHFHVRFPIVARLVSYFTSASFRRMLRNGETGSQVVHREVHDPAAPELDYRFVKHDVSGDPWVESAVAKSFFTDEKRYTDSLVALREIFLSARAELGDGGVSSSAREAILRRLDDAPRRLVFEALAEARERGRRDPERGSGDALALESAEAVLGPRAAWFASFKRYTLQGTPRLVVIPTWQCELRCAYCYIPKQDGRVMSRQTLERSIELLLGSSRDELILQFFGGEALMEWDLVRFGMELAASRAAALGKRISFVLSSNGWSLDADKLAWLRQFDTKLELSLDGDPDTQNVFRIAHEKKDDSYHNGIAPRAKLIHESGIPYEVIMVVHPRNASKLAHNFFHIADLGFERIQINFALGSKWSSQQMSAFAGGLLEVGEELRRRWDIGGTTALVNAENQPKAVLLNGEITVDHDGTLYGGNGFLHETEHKDRFAIGHLDDLGSFDRYYLDAPDNEFLLRYSYPQDVTKNNLEVGKIFVSFLQWMREGRFKPGASAQSGPAPAPMRDAAVEE